MTHRKTRADQAHLRPKSPTWCLLGLMMIVGALALAGLAPSAANANAITDPSLTCTALSGYKFELPANGRAQGSQFWFSVDNGSWQQTNWVYTDGWQTWEFVGSNWQYINWGGAIIPNSFPDEVTHHIVAWEWRAWSNSNGWHYLGECDASSYHYGGGVIGVGH